jgi:ribosomal protein S18 acetylase RimI-like enzyme
MKSDIVVRKLETGDLQEASGVHIAAFADSALTRLGREAVMRYYEWQLNGPHDVAALGAFAGGKMAGFCFAGVFRGSMSGFLRKEWKFLCWRLLTHPWLASNPILRERLVYAIRVLKRYGRPRKSEPSGKEKKPVFGILSIAVDPGFQGRGVGKLLMEEAERIARRQEFAEMDLTVHPQNHQALRFYEGLGWKRISVGESWAGLMRKDLCA